MPRLMRTAKLIFASLPAFVAVGCGSILGIPSDPRLAENDGGVSDLEGTGELPDNWSCIYDAPLDRTVAASAHVSVRVCDYGKPCVEPTAEHFTANVCVKAECSRPIIEDLEIQDGYFEFDLDLTPYPNGFDGYLSISSGTAHCTNEATFGFLAGSTLCAYIGCEDASDLHDPTCFSPTHAVSHYNFSPPVTGTNEPDRYVSVANLVAAVTVAGNSGANVVTGNKAAVEAVVHDCNGDPSSGVVLSANAAEYKVAYKQDGVYNDQGTETNASGAAFLFDLSPGYVIVTAQVDGITVSTGSATLVPDSSAYLVMEPESLQAQ